MLRLIEPKIIIAVVVAAVAFLPSSPSQSVRLSFHCCLSALHTLHVSERMSEFVRYV